MELDVDESGEDEPNPPVKSQRTQSDSESEASSSNIISVIPSSSRRRNNKVSTEKLSLPAAGEGSSVKKGYVLFSL